MTDTYIGWDGKSYPWPPPEGWYEASDGRWWAPGTGPNPPPTGGQQTASRAATPPPAAASSGVEVEDVARTAQLPAYGAPGPAQDRGQAAAQAGLTAPAAGRAASGAAAPPTAFGHGPPPTGPTGTTAEWDRPPTEPEGRGPWGRVLLVLAGMVLALVVAGGALLLLRDTGSDTASDSGETATEGTDDPAGAEETGGDGLGSDTTQSSDDPPTDEAATDDTSGPDDSAPTTTTAPDETTTTADPAAQVAQFRSILADNGLTSDGLSDDDISTFSTTFCIFAVAAEGPTEYERFRSERVAQADSELTPEELAIVIDAAVVVFCPDEADRLGVSV